MQVMRGMRFENLDDPVRGVVSPNVGGANVGRSRSWLDLFWPKQSLNEAGRRARSTGADQLRRVPHGFKKRFIYFQTSSVLLDARSKRALDARACVKSAQHNNRFDSFQR